MFLVSTKKGEEDWVKCKDCGKWLDGGPTCSHCASATHRHKAAEALEAWAIANGPADSCYLLKEEPDASVER
eukprot:1776474-Lingulodinium_polyedra.AAC.1